MTSPVSFVTTKDSSSRNQSDCVGISTSVDVFGTRSVTGVCVAFVIVFLDPAFHIRADRNDAVSLVQCGIESVLHEFSGESSAAVVFFDHGLYKDPLLCAVGCFVVSIYFSTCNSSRIIDDHADVPILLKKFWVACGWSGHLVLLAACNRWWVLSWLHRYRRQCWRR